MSAQNLKLFIQGMGFTIVVHDGTAHLCQSIEDGFAYIESIGLKTFDFECMSAISSKLTAEEFMAAYSAGGGEVSA